MRSSSFLIKSKNEKKTKKNNFPQTFIKEIKLNKLIKF